MKLLKKLVAAATLSAMVLASSNALVADQGYSSTGGYGYVESHRAPSIAPAIALGVIAAVAIIAVCIQNSNNSHGHGSSHDQQKVKFVSVREGAVAVLFLIFLSSCSQNCPHWIREDICSPCPQYSSSRLFVTPRALCSLIDFELVRDCTDDRLYVNVLSIAIPESDGYPGATAITITIGDVSHEMMAARFDGGQRFLLPSDGRDLIIDALRAGEPVTVCVNRYQQTFPPTNFNNVF